jgi:hypothetical protein
VSAGFEHLSQELTFEMRDLRLPNIPERSVLFFPHPENLLIPSILIQTFS